MPRFRCIALTLLATSACSLFTAPTPARVEVVSTAYLNFGTQPLVNVGVELTTTARRPIVVAVTSRQFGCRETTIHPSEDTTRFGVTIYQVPGYAVHFPDTVTASTTERCAR